MSPQAPAQADFLKAVKFARFVSRRAEDNPAPNSSRALPYTHNEVEEAIRYFTQDDNGRAELDSTAWEWAHEDIIVQQNDSKYARTWAPERVRPTAVLAGLPEIFDLRATSSTATVSLKRSTSPVPQGIPSTALIQRGSPARPGSHPVVPSASPASTARLYAAIAATTASAATATVKKRPPKWPLSAPVSTALFAVATYVDNSGAIGPLCASSGSYAPPYRRRGGGINSLLSHRCLRRKLKFSLLWCFPGHGLTGTVHPEVATAAEQLALWIWRHEQMLPTPGLEPARRLAQAAWNKYGALRPSKGWARPG
ncbi:uncharacterized protein B0I36DRAFT_348833 [Microdochium trichocladiopsis]|uniref:Uncharacterized protein n=1 Tax=Microdochium trichocladiopsis TaxID=1682393 RepID=A0A9P8Y615_9PEZI|nr:uncharacterized protein B0I36DRAFT_348833 [Microdochium trichocladiopsis]KAH7030627.1 hypothetical protein B0I36DRAFT_348833 [Microdochium trichocladiopsis]